MADADNTVVVDLTEDAAPAAVDPNLVVIPAEGADDDALPDNAVMQDDGTILLTLNYPVSLKWKTQGSDAVREDKHTTLTFHRLTGADVTAMLNNGNQSNAMVGMARSCRLPSGRFKAIYDRMDGGDAIAAARCLSFFLSPGSRKATGQPSSP